MQFGFMPGRGTIDAILTARKLQEKYLGNKKNCTMHLLKLGRRKKSVTPWKRKRC